MPQRMVEEEHSDDEDDQQLWRLFRSSWATGLGAQNIRRSQSLRSQDSQSTWLAVVPSVSGLVCSMILQLFVHVDLGDFEHAASQFPSTINLPYPQQSAPATFYGWSKHRPHKHFILKAFPGGPLRCAGQQLVLWFHPLRSQLRLGRQMFHSAVSRIGTFQRCLMRICALKRLKNLRWKLKIDTGHRQVLPAVWNTSHVWFSITSLYISESHLLMVRLVLVPHDKFPKDLSMSFLKVAWGQTVKPGASSDKTCSWRCFGDCPGTGLGTD